MNRIWIIDDEESIRTICMSALEDLFEVESFANASEALLELNSKQPDLIIKSSYNANNSTDGPFVYLGFKPKFLIIKSSAAISWYVIDATRSPINPATAGITVDNSQAEFTNQFTIDFLSNGFKWRRNSPNFNQSTHIYLAFAEIPFKTSTAR